MKKERAGLFVSVEGEITIFQLKGKATIHCLAKFEKQLARAMDEVETPSIKWDLSQLKSMDSALAILITKAVQRAHNSDKEVIYTSMTPEVQKMLGMAGEHTHFGRDFTPVSENIVHKIGRESGTYFKQLLDFLSFFGQVSLAFVGMFYRLKDMRYKEMSFELYESGIKALPIIALTMFLVGIVVAYQSAAQLKLYGANIFIVDMLGISILRELAPMLAAIIVAGRSGSSYAAQIGVMKITEELDAMRTMGFDPYVFLVLPRMIALMIMMPILIFFADIAGVIGGMLIAKVDLGLSSTLFLERFAEVVNVKHFWIGLFKGPFFAILIATIGIYRGLQVKNDTQSIGFNTTKAVVESIFAVIICDAFFSIVFTNLGF